MERRGCSLGCIIAGLGALLTCCLAPYLVSSIYSIITALLQVQSPPDWLWGDWLNTVVGESDVLYMFMAEGPICCVGSIGLLIVILGLVMMISGIGKPQEEYYEGEYEPDDWQASAPYTEIEEPGLEIE
jgi:hypothetical protein